ncbi:MAG: AAC(3) family N-acetyltransferase, partial [Ktedonobacteraceae bacterium]|nr:AAC(3) family N-acetyltransferase [Ktedonobacteraceae bacterium]
ENGQSIWGAYRDIDVNSSVFPEIASEFARSSEVLTGPVGSAPATLAPVKPLIDFATGWYTRKRGESASS